MHRLGRTVEANVIYVMGHRSEKSCLRGFANNTGADQPVHSRNLTSAFIIRVLESIYLSLLQAIVQYSS